MMYPYVSGYIVYFWSNEEGELIHVHVSKGRPTDNGFDSARCELPEYKWTEKEGYSDEEIAFFEKLLHSNAHLLYKYAANGGIKIA